MTETWNHRSTFLSTECQGEGVKNKQNKQAQCGEWKRDLLSFHACVTLESQTGERRNKSRQSPECLTRAAKAACLSTAADWLSPGLFGAETSILLMVVGAYEALMRSAVTTLWALLPALYFVCPGHMFFISSHNRRVGTHVISWHPTDRPA